MADKKIDDIAERKKKLEEELEQIQSELDHSLDEVRMDVSSQFRPKVLIKKYPLQSVGISVVLGFLVGKKRKPSSGGSSDNNNLAGMILDELKGMATKKAVNFLFDYLDSAIDQKKEEILNENGQDK